MEGCQEAAWVQAEPSRCAPGPLTVGKKLTHVSGRQVSSAATEAGAHGAVCAACLVFYLCATGRWTINPHHSSAVSLPLFTHGTYERSHWQS